MCMLTYINSPWAKFTSLSAYSPAPGIGESPTRPQDLNGLPLVDVPSTRSRIRNNMTYSIYMLFFTPCSYIACECF